MNEKADSGSMGVIVLELSQLTHVSIDGKPIDENISLENVEESGYNEKGQLTETEKLQLKEKTGWSDDIVDYIGSMKEAQIYINADLKEAKINGKKCLISDDINLQQKNKFGISNMELLSKGYAPVTKDGEKIELHHIGQTQNSPLVELVEQDHRGKINDKILHNKRKKSEINRLVFAVERKKHWKIRPNYINSLIIGDNYEN